MAVFHDQEASLAQILTALAALGIAQRRKDDQIFRSARLLDQLLLPFFRQLLRDPLGVIKALFLGSATGRELKCPQLSAALVYFVFRYRGFQAMRFRPLLEQPQSVSQLPGIARNSLLEVGNMSAAPSFHLSPLEQSH